MYTVWGTEPEATARNTKDSITHSVVVQKEIETISALIDNELLLTVLQLKSHLNGVEFIAQSP